MKVSPKVKKSMKRLGRIRLRSDQDLKLTDLTVTRRSTNGSAHSLVRVSISFTPRSLCHDILDLYFLKKIQKSNQPTKIGAERIQSETLTVVPSKILSQHHYANISGIFFSH